MTTYKYAEDIKELAEVVIKENAELHYINLSEINFIRTSKHITGDFTLARCHLLTELTQFISGKKYVIEIPPVFDTLSDKVKKIVLEHEMSHIPIEVDSKGLVPHDIGEFMKIVTKYGLDYVNEYKEAQNKIKILKEKEKLEKKIKKQEGE